MPKSFSLIREESNRNNLHQYFTLFFYFLLFSLHMYILTYIITRILYRNTFTHIIPYPFKLKKKENFLHIPTTYMHTHEI